MEQKSWDSCYPRPQLRRDSFFPLNEGWTLNGRPIRAPWPPQAPLSRWRGTVGDVLWYQRLFSLPEGFLAQDQRLLLHFGAVDQVAEVFVNGRALARHEGGYLPFCVDVTDELRRGQNRLEVKAVDTLSTDYPYGKQHKRPHGMWYTPVSGIWQTVWLEAVPAHGAVASLRLTPDLHGVTIEADTGGEDFAVAVPLDSGRILTAAGNGTLRLDIPEPHLWTPEDPWLYTMTIATPTDKVESYFALRTMTIEQVGLHTRLCLNGKPVFLHGVLDQGYFQDGLFLPRAPEEYERDVLRMKALGFNTLRKHIKIEPEAFYCACDRLGMLVMQDMVNSGEYHYVRDTVLPTLGCQNRSDLDQGGSEHRKAMFERHCLDTVAHLRNHPCVVGWTIFNEGWGQYDSDRIYRMLKPADPTRFFISASGWFAQRESDAQSEHVYFNNRLQGGAEEGRFLFLSECGGFSRRVEGHVAQDRKNYGYGQQAASEAELTARIRALYDDLVLPAIDDEGLCGCVYTQLSDVEGETNGLYTYDRQVRKVDAETMLDIAADVRQALEKAVGNG